MPKIRLAGIGTAEIQFPDFRIFIDACNEYLEIPQIETNDILFFTHSDKDHFDAEKTLAAVHKTKNRIIATPSCAYPLLAKTNLNPDLLQIVYPPHIHRPTSLKIGDLEVKVYQTKHFVDWEPDHVSYLFKYKEKRIYFTGDSHVFDTEDPEIYEVDALICNLVIKEVIKKQMSSQAGAHELMQKLIEIQLKLKPKLIFGNHLLDCDWTVATTDMQKEAKQSGYSNIIIPSDTLTYYEL